MDIDLDELEKPTLNTNLKIQGDIKNFFNRLSKSLYSKISSKGFKNKEVIGEITIVISGIHKEKNEEINKLELKKDLNELIHAGLSLSAASKYLAKKYCIKKSIIYNLN